MHLLLLFGIEEKQTQFPKGLKAAHFHSARFFAASTFGLRFDRKFAAFRFPSRLVAKKGAFFHFVVSGCFCSNICYTATYIVSFAKSHKKWDQNIDMTAEFYQEKPTQWKSCETFMSFYAESLEFWYFYITVLQGVPRCLDRF